MKQIRYIDRVLLAGIACIPALSGCIYDENITPPDNRQEVTFSINIPGSSAPDTRALGNGEENEVQTIEVLLFDPQTDNVIGNPVFANNISTDSGDVTKKTFSVRLPEGTFDVMVFANARKAFNATVIAAGEEQAEILARLTTSMPANGWAANPADADKKYLIPMWGMKENLSIGDGTSISGVWLHRMVSRIDLLVTGDDEFTGDFKLKDIKLYNAQKEGRIAPATANWNAVGKINGVTMAGLAVSPSTVAGSGVHPAISYASVISADKKGCMGEMYLFEAPKATGHADPNAPFLTVKGEFEGVEGWYRIDLADYDGMTYLDVLRNHRYGIHIERVSGTGFPDEADAVKNRGDNIVVDITLWNEYDMGGTKFDGQHFLSIAPQEMEFTTYAHSGASFTIRTDLDSEISLSGIKLSGSPSDPDAALAGNWIADLSLSPKNVVGDKNVYTLSFDVADNGNGDRDNRTGYIYVTCGRLTNVVRIEQHSIDLAALVGLQVAGATEVPVVGGESGLIELTGVPTAMESKLSMKVSFATLSGTALDGRALVRHEGVLTDENGNTFDPGRSYPVTQRFRVKFPKLYYPNREISGITGVVTVTLSDGTTKACTISQSPLAPKAMSAWNVSTGGGVGWGNVVGDDDYNPYLKYLLERIPGWSGEGVGTSNNYLTVIPDRINYVHVTLNFDDNAPADFTWGRVNDWRASHPDGLTVLTAHNDGGVPLLNLATSPLNSDSEGNEYSTRYPNAVYGNIASSGDVHHIRSASSHTKVYRYVMQYAVNKLVAGNLPTGFYSDANNFSSIPVEGLPSSAVPMLQHANGRSTLIIDPERHLVYFGETEHFQSDRLSNNRDMFLENVVKYMENAAKYGTHFTDLLIESGPDAQPAPWDSYWGDNALE